MQFGVDEAGKGPVLGSMFAAAVLATPEEIPDAVDDSKRLDPPRRRSIAESLHSNADVRIGISEIPVERIDDPETDMNTLTVEAHAAALSAVAADDLAGLIDAGDTDADRFARRVESRVASEVSIEARHHADAENPLVAAASIVAKVERDAHVEDLQSRYDTPIGSGYPGDETTRTFLEDYVREQGALPACARSSWRTSRDVLAAAEQTGLTDF
ncbi:MAG: ribonuclease HII [Halodesulfurarchaeum sp.]